MRVIGGSARGRRLKGPPRRPRRGQPAIRPTSDLVREAMFDMLDAMGADYGRVLDLYAGTGALGIEALSRGDGTADFVDSDRDALAIVAENLQRTGFGARGTAHPLEAARAASRLQGPYTLVLADPPYYDTDAFAAARAAAESLSDERTVVVVEHHRNVTPPPSLGALPLYRSRRHGETVISIYAQEEPR